MFGLSVAGRCGNSRIGGRCVLAQPIAPQGALPPPQNELEVGSWKSGVGSWKLEVGSWKLEVGSWKLEVGSWKLEVGSWRLEVLQSQRPLPKYLIMHSPL